MSGDSDSLKRKEPIIFKFSEKKALAAAGLLLQDAGGKMEYLRLIKLLYLADRKSIARRGQPIVGGCYVSMKFGPVLSGVLDLVNYGGVIWSNTIKTEEFQVSLKRRPDLGALSQEEMLTLKKIAKLCEKFDQWTICKKMHRLPEWKDPKGGAIEISPEEILKHLKYTEKEIRKIHQEAIERDYFNEVFGS